MGLNRHKPEWEGKAEPTGETPSPPPSRPWGRGLTSGRASCTPSRAWPSASGRKWEASRCFPTLTWTMIKDGARTGGLPRSEPGRRRCLTGPLGSDTRGECGARRPWRSFIYAARGDLRDCNCNLGRIFPHRPRTALSAFPRGPGQTRVSGPVGAGGVKEASHVKTGRDGERKGAGRS